MPQMKRHPGQLDTMATLRRLMREKFEISAEQVNGLLEKHGLGRMKAMASCEANLMNTVFDVTLEGGGGVILKVQHRPTPGWLLETEVETIQLLRQKTVLPVSDLCLLDVERDVIPHSVLISSKLPGTNGKAFFEGANLADRMALSERLGEVTEVIHGVEVPEGTGLRINLLGEWRGVVQEALRGDATLRREIEEFYSGFFSQYDALMDAVDIQVIGEDPVLLWNEGIFASLLVERGGGTVRVTGVFDFQSAGYGSRVFDFTRVEGDFNRKQPPGVYGHPEFVDCFYRGYEAAGGRRERFEPFHYVILDVIRKARQVRYWWDCARFLHPKNPDCLADVLAGLRKLANYF